MGKGKSIEKWKIDYIKANHQDPVKQIADAIGVRKSVVYDRLKMMKLDKRTLFGGQLAKLEAAPQKKFTRPPAQYSNKQYY